MYLHLPFSSFSYQWNTSGFFIPLITTALLKSCHSFTLPAQENWSLTLYKLPCHKYWDLKCFWDNSFSREMRIALPTGIIWQRFLVTFSPEAFTTGRESLFAMCRGGNTDQQDYVRASCDRHTVLPWHGKSSSPWQGHKGEKEPL